MSYGKKRISRLLVAAVIGALGARAFAADTITNDFVYIDNGYHWQQTSYYCGPSSLEMMLDCNAVRSTNAQVNALFNNPPPLNSGLTQDQWIQYQIYYASRSRALLPIQGTDPTAFSLTINAYDGVANGLPLPNGIAQGGSAGTGRGYGWYGFVNTNYGAALASRTVANAIHDYGVPATVSVMHGAHWVDVNGVIARAGDTIGRNNNYQIQYFSVKDPWNGYVAANPGQTLPAGIGVNKWLRYGYDSTGRSPGWFNYFNANGNFGPFSNQYVAIVDPQGPELPDTGNGGLYDSLPPAPAELGSDRAPGARADAISDFSADPRLSALPEFQGGAFDLNAADELLVQLPTDTATQGDWLVPYDDGGGHITGYVLVDAETGLLDEIGWINAGDPFFTLPGLDTMVQQDYAGNLPVDNLPEPATLSLLIPGAALILRRRHAG